MKAIFGHDGGVHGMQTAYGTEVPSGPSAFAQAQSQYTAGISDPRPAVRRPHLRGSLVPARPEQEKPVEADWSTTGEPSPARDPGASKVDLSNPATPTAGAPLSEVMADQYLFIQGFSLLKYVLNFNSVSSLRSAICFLWPLL